MATVRCNFCDQAFESQKPLQGTVIQSNHASSDCPFCSGQLHKSRGRLGHHQIIDDEYRAIPDPNVKHVPAVPIASESYTQMQELISKLQGQLDLERQRGDEIERSLQRLAALPLRPGPAAQVVEAPPVGPAHMEQANKSVEATR